MRANIDVTKFKDGPPSPMGKRLVLDIDLVPETEEERKALEAYSQDRDFLIQDAELCLRFFSRRTATVFLRNAGTYIYG